MKNHSKIHDDVYNFTCDVCGRKFRRPYTLNVHMRSHTKICPYTCRFCGKSFPHNVTLQVKLNWLFYFRQLDNFRIFQTHERAHINDKPHACTECSYRSTAKGNLNKHMMRAHCKWMTSYLAHKIKQSMSKIPTSPIFQTSYRLPEPCCRAKKLSRAIYLGKK